MYNIFVSIPYVLRESLYREVLKVILKKSKSELVLVYR